MSDIKPFQSYRDFRHDFETKPVYTRLDMDKAIEACVKEHTVNRVIMQGKDYDIAMMILAIRKTPEGITVIVR